MLIQEILHSAIWVDAPAWRVWAMQLPMDRMHTDVLTVTDSLTRVLEREYKLKLTVVVHAQYVDKATERESTLLNIQADDQCLRRKVSLLSQGDVMFDAESVLPLAVLPATLMAALEAGQRPLANLLSDRGLSLSRSDLSIAQLSTENHYDGLWARRSVLRAESGATALVTEVFHHAFWRKLDLLSQA